MRGLSLAILAPLLALAAPAKHNDNIPELTVSEWSAIQGGFIDNVRSLTHWSWNKAEEIAEEIAGSVDEYRVHSNDDSDLTIWQQLKADSNSFSRLVKVLEFEGKAYKILDDKDLQITFFAPNNDALRPPEHHGHHGHHDHDDDFELMALDESPSLSTLSSMLDTHSYLLSDDDKGGDDDDKKKKRREMFRKIAGKILQYHGLEKAYTAAELAQNSTVPTALKAGDGSYGGLHRRIKLEKTFIPPSLKINGYAKVLVADKKARNGYFHTLNHPLLPPPSIMQSAFLFPDFFSTATSATQQVHARKYLDWQYDHEHSKPGKPSFWGNPLVTFFLPSNTAFHLLPFKLKFYLFSPFGERALAKLLMYHGVPETLLLTEFYYKDKEAKPTPDFMVMGDDPSFHKEFDVHTALPNATLHIEVDKSKIVPIEGAVKISMKVNGEYVEAIDVPARNGAFHVIGKVLIPPHEHHDPHGENIAHLDTWENWSEWFPAWAAQE